MTLRRSLETAVRRNLIALGADFVFFTVGFVFFDPLVILPAFVQVLTGSELAVGALAAARIIVITLPQLLAANMLAKRAYKRPLLIASSLGGRLPLLLLIAMTLWLSESRPWLVVFAVGMATVLFFTSEGLNSVIWPDLVAKVIPESVRGRFLGGSQLLSSFVGLGAGWAVRRLLGGALPFPTDWAAIYACAFLGFGLSMVAMLAIDEKAGQIGMSVRADLRTSLRIMRRYFRIDRRLRFVIVLQWLCTAAGATFPFLVIRAKELLPYDVQVLGTFLIAQSLGGMLAAVVCGQIIDRMGAWLGIRVVLIVQALVLAAILLAGWGWALFFCLLTFAALGFVNGSSWWVFSAYLMEIAPDRARPHYIATSGVLTTPLALLSIAIGGLYELVPPATLFGLALVTSLVALGIGLTMPSTTFGKKLATDL